MLEGFSCPRKAAKRALDEKLPYDQPKEQSLRANQFAKASVSMKCVAQHMHIGQLIPGCCCSRWLVAGGWRVAGERGTRGGGERGEGRRSLRFLEWERGTGK